MLGGLPFVKDWTIGFTLYFDYGNNEAVAPSTSADACDGALGQSCKGTFFVGCSCRAFSSIHLELDEHMLFSSFSIVP